MSKKNILLATGLLFIVIGGSYFGYTVYRDRFSVGVSEFQAGSQSCGQMNGNLCCTSGSICPQSGGNYSCPSGYTSLGDSTEPTGACKPCCIKGTFYNDDPNSGEMCTSPGPAGAGAPVVLRGQCLSTSNTLIWPGVEGNSSANILYRSVDGGPWQRVFSEYFYCRWNHSNGYTDIDMQSGHVYRYRQTTDVGNEDAWSNIITCPPGPTPVPTAVPGYFCPPENAICGLQYESMKRKGLVDYLCGNGVGHGDSAYNLRFGHGNFDPASGKGWNVMSSSDYYDYTTWAWGQYPAINQLAGWCNLNGDPKVDVPKSQPADGSSPTGPPKERPSTDAWQIRCFYSYYLYTQGKATWNDVTGGINYDLYPLCNRCKGKDCSDSSKVSPAVYKWRSAPSTVTPTAVNPKLLIDGVGSSTKRQNESFTIVASGLTPSGTVIRWIKKPGATNAIQLSPALKATVEGKIIWKYTPNCTSEPGTYTIWVTDSTTNKKSNEVKEVLLQNSACATGQTAKPSDYGLTEGDMITAFMFGDPDVFIINQYGFKRLFLNEVIFSFYGHLGGWPSVKPVSLRTRDAFSTSLLLKNCETNDSQVYALQVTGSDTGTLHPLNIPHDTAISQDPNFDKKTFCINNNEFNWYSRGEPYTSLSQVK